MGSSELRNSCFGQNKSNCLMPIELVTPLSTIKASFEAQYDKNVRAVIIEAFKKVGESCVNQARMSGKYKDIKGNLRSSIAFVVAENSIIVEEGSSQKFLEGTIGETEGVKYARSLAAEAGRGITLIVSAGMKYAVFVEARGLDVLSSAELLAESLTPQILKQLGFEIR